MDALLHFVGLSYVIRGNPPEKHDDDASKDDKEAYTAWEYYNKLARHLLIGFISNDMVKQFEQLTSAKEIYDQVIEKCDASTMFMEAFRNYLNNKMPKGTSINDHIDQMNIRLRNVIA